MSLFTKDVNPKDKRIEDKNKLEIQRARTPEELADIEKEQAKRKFEEVYKEPSEDILGIEGKEQNLIGKLEVKFEGTNDIEGAVDKLVNNEPNISKNLPIEDREELQLLVTEHVLGIEEKKNNEKSKEGKIDYKSLTKEVKENPDFPVLKLALENEEITIEDFEKIIAKVDKKTDYKHAIEEAFKSNDISQNTKEKLEKKYKRLEEERKKLTDLPTEVKEILSKYGIKEEKENPFLKGEKTLYELFKENYNLYLTGEDKESKEKNLIITIEKVFNTIIFGQIFMRDTEYFKKTEKVLRSDDDQISRKLLYIKSIHRYLNSPEVRSKNTGNLQELEDENNIINTSREVANDSNEKPIDKFARVQELLKKADTKAKEKVINGNDILKRVRDEEAQNDENNNLDDDLDNQFKNAA